MATAAAKSHDGVPQGGPLEADFLIDYCSRPNCRKEFRRTARPGRPQEYCSEICRRAAEKEFRRARSRLAHYEGLVEKLRVDVAAHGRPDAEQDGDDQLPVSLDARQRAENAVRRASGVLRFADPDDPAVQELQMLYRAVAPVILSDLMAG
jgi:hypothetical protein